MKAYIIALSKVPRDGAHNLLLKCNGIYFFVRVEPDDADQLLATGKFEVPEGGWYEAIYPPKKKKKVFNPWKIFQSIF